MTTESPGNAPRPRRPLRGSDFLMRWAQGEWSERRIEDAINATDRYRAVAYGPSGVAPERPDLADQYFERLGRAQQPGLKRPDLLVIRNVDRSRADEFLQSIGGATELQFTREDQLRPLLDLAVVAVECENSLWKAERMPDYGKPLRFQRRTGKLGMPKSAVLPTVILKEEDRKPLRLWEQTHGIELHIWQIFFDRAWGIALQRACQLIRDGDITATDQTFHAPSGATTKKVIYKI